MTVEGRSAGVNHGNLIRGGTVVCLPPKERYWWHRARLHRVRTAYGRSPLGGSHVQVVVALHRWWIHEMLRSQEGPHYREGDETSCEVEMGTPGEGIGPVGKDACGRDVPPLGGASRTRRIGVRAPSGLGWIQPRYALAMQWQGTGELFGPRPRLRGR